MEDKKRPRRVLSRASIGLILATLALMAVGGLTFLKAPPPAPAPAALPAGFDLQGHRGARGLAPENTWLAFETALGLGVTTLELDLGMTRGGVLVVHHGPRLDPARTRGPDGAWIAAEAPPLLRDLSFEQLAAYDVGRARPDSRVAERFPAQEGADAIGIPTLSQVLAQAEARAGGAMRYNLETKLRPDAPEETASPEDFAAAVVAALAEAGIAGRASVQSFDWRSLQALQRLAPEIPTVYLTAEQDWLDNLERGRPGASPWTAGFDLDAHEGSVARLVQAAGGAVWSPYFRDLREADLREAQRLGLPVVVWTVNDPADMDSLIERGVDGIITDYPDRLRAVMERRGLPLPPAFKP